MSVSTSRLAAFASAAALGFGLMGPAEVFASQATPAPHSARVKKEDPNITAARKNLRDAKDPKRAGESALKDLQAAWDNLRKSGFSPAAGEGFKELGLTETQFLKMKAENFRQAMRNHLAEAQKPENAGVEAYKHLQQIFTLHEQLQDLRISKSEEIKDIVGISDTDIYTLGRGQAKIAAQQTLEKAVLTLSSDPIAAYSSFISAESYMYEAGIWARDNKLADINTSTMILNDIQRRILIDAAHQSYAQRTNQAEGLESYLKIYNAVGYLQAEKVLPGSDHNKGILTELGVDAETFMPIYRSYGAAAANNILTQVEDPKQMGTEDALKNLKLLPTIVHTAQLDGLSEEQYNARLANNLTMAANLALEEARKPENAGRPAIMALERASDFVFRAAQFQTDPDIRKKQQEIANLLPDYNDLYLFHLATAARHDLMLAKDPANAGMVAYYHLNQIDLYQQLSNAKHLPYFLETAEINPAELAALRKKTGIYIARENLKTLKSQIASENDYAEITAERVKRYLEFAGFNFEKNDDGYAALGLTGKDFFALEDKAHCISFPNRCPAPGHAPKP